MSLENVRFGLDVLDDLLPNGVPRTSFVLLAGPSGVGKTCFVLNIVKQFLLRQEPVIYILFDDDPITITMVMSRLGVDIYGYIRDRLLMIVDGFSYRIKDKKGRIHISVVDEVDPENTEQVLYTAIQHINGNELRGRGLMVIDSLNELLFYHENIKVAEFVKNIRANIAKFRGILTLAVLHLSSDKAKQFLTLVEHAVDGIIILDQIPKNGAVSVHVHVKKMKGVEHRHEKIELTKPPWHSI